MKRLGDWEYVLGVNTMNQHLSYMSMEGSRKYDYPPSFSYHNVWWPYYKQLNEYFSRLSLFLSAGKQKNGILILEPTTSAWMYFVGSGEKQRFHEIGQNFQSFITILEKSQVEYDLGCEDVINDHGKVVTNSFIVGQASYHTVVLPPGTENLNNSTFELLLEFVKAGGKLLLFEDITYIDGKKDKRLDLLIPLSVKFDKSVLPNDPVIHNYFSSDNISFHQNRPVTGDLYHHRRVISDGQIIFLANTSMTESTSGYFKIQGRDVVHLNAQTGELLNYPTEKKDNGNLIIQYDIPEAGSLLLFISNKPLSSEFKESPAFLTDEKIKCSELQIKRLETNVLTLDFCDLEMNDTIIKEQYFDNISNYQFYHYQFNDGNPWCSSIQYKNNIIQRDTFGMGTSCSVNYHCYSDDTEITDLKAVVERTDLWDIFINDELIKPLNGQWWLDKSFKVFCLEGKIKKGKNTITLKALHMSVFAEIEPIYILGNFSLESQKKGWKIKADKPIKKGSWKDSGMPLYGKGVSYQKTFDIDKKNKQCQVNTGKWEGTVALLKINGQTAATLIGNEKYVNISDYIIEGRNTAELIIIGSLKNTLGPFYKNSSGFASPWDWKYIPHPITGEKYDLKDYGLMESFEIIN
jgi:hypothetical protein